MINHVKLPSIAIAEICAKPQTCVVRLPIIVLTERLEDNVHNILETQKVDVRATPKPVSSIAHSTVSRALASWAHTLDIRQRKGRSEFSLK